MKEPKVTRIEITYEDGSKLLAGGEDADAIWRWWGSCETMNCIHGAVFKGKQFEKILAPEAS